MDRTASQPTEERDIRIGTGSVALDGILSIPEDARGIVVFAHGSGSSRKSPRNRFVAEALQDHGLATLLMDLLTRDEEELDRRTGHLRFDIPMLATRVEGAVAWLNELPETASLSIGIFGASTGAAAALLAAAALPNTVQAVVSRGGRPDLADDRLPEVPCPTLLIVGGLDHPVIEMNEEAKAKMKAPVELKILPGATHLFEEEGALERVADLAAQWFVKHLHRVVTERQAAAHAARS